MVWDEELGLICDQAPRQPPSFWLKDLVPSMLIDSFGNPDSVSGCELLHCFASLVEDEHWAGPDLVLVGQLR